MRKDPLLGQDNSFHRKNSKSETRQLKTTPGLPTFGIKNQWFETDPLVHPATDSAGTPWHAQKGGLYLDPGYQHEGHDRLC